MTFVKFTDQSRRQIV